MRTSKLNFDKAVAIKIILYFVLAYAISYFLYLLPNFLPLYGIKWILNPGFGPFLSAIIVSYLYKTPLRLRFFSDTTWVRKIEFVGLGVFLIGTIINSVISGNTDYSLVIFWTVFALFYALLEELGWRVFLGNELGEYSFLTIVLTSAALWFAWHYSFFNRLTLANPLQFLGMIVALAHACVNVNLPNLSILPILIIFLAVTIGLLKFYETKNKKANAKS